MPADGLAPLGAKPSADTVMTKCTENLEFIMMTTLSSLMVPQVIIMPTCGTASGNNIGIMTALGFQLSVSFTYQWVNAPKM